MYDGWIGGLEPEGFRSKPVDQNQIEGGGDDKSIRNSIAL